MDLAMKINLAQSTLSVSERKVATYLLDNIETAPRMSLGTMAKTVDVSMPTITRLAKKLGYDGFMDFRLSLAMEANEKKLYEEAGSENTVPNDVNKHFSRTIMSIVQTAQALSIDDSEEIAARIMDACRVFIVVSDVSTPHGIAFSEKLIKLGIDSTLVLDNAALPAILQKTTVNDLFIILSCSRHSKATQEALRAIHEYNAYTVFICNYMNTAAHSIADKFISAARIDGLNRTVAFCPDIGIAVVLNLILELISEN